MGCTSTTANMLHAPVLIRHPSLHSSFPLLHELLLLQSSVSPPIQMQIQLYPTWEMRVLIMRKEKRQQNVGYYLQEEFSLLPGSYYLTACFRWQKWELRPSLQPCRFPWSPLCRASWSALFCPCTKAWAGQDTAANSPSMSVCIWNSERARFGSYVHMPEIHRQSLQAWEGLSV